MSVDRGVQNTTPCQIQSTYKLTVLSSRRERRRLLCYRRPNTYGRINISHLWQRDRNFINKRLCYCRGTARRAALRQLKYYGRFLTELLTRSCSNYPEEPCEHTVSWNRVKRCTNVRLISCENVCNRWMTFKVIQGHCRCHHLIGHILFPISLPL